MVQCSNGLDMGIQRRYFLIRGIALLDTMNPSFTNMFSVHYFFQCISLNQVALLFRYFLANYSLQKSLSKDFILLDLLNVF